MNSTIAATFADQMETTFCNFCAADAAKPLFKVSGFQIVSCRKCGLTYTNPRLKRSALRAVYDQTYFKSADSLTHGYENYEKERPSIQRTFRERWNGILRFSRAQTGRVLDVGCALGYLLDIAKKDGWRVDGLDTSEFAVDYANRALGLPVQLSDLEEIPFDDQTFDVITMWDVIEHLPDPMETIRTCFARLKPGGLFSVITPDRSSAFARLFQHRWVEYQKPHEHLYFFSRREFCQALERAGFEVLWTGTAGKYVPLGFVLERLEAYQKTLFKFLGTLAKKTGIASLTLPVNPRDKMSIIVRRPA